MFLVNSRSLLVTETNSFQSWHPFFQRYRANLPNSLAWIEPIRHGFLTQGHLCQFSVRSWIVAPADFSLAPGIGKSGQNVRLITYSPRSHHYGSPEVSTLQQAGEPVKPTRMRHRQDKAIHGAGILTCFPFDVFD